MASYRPILIGWLCLCGASPVLAQNDSPGPLQTGSGAELSVRRTTLEDEIASVEAQLGSAEATGTGDAVLVSKLETLRQIDFVLSLQQLTQDESETLNRELQGASEKLERLQTAGLEEPTPVAIRILDAGHDALESALARAQSLRLEIAAAEAAAESAASAAEEAGRQRRQKRDEMERADDPLDSAKLQREVEALQLAERAATAIADLRLAELATKKQQANLASKQVGYLQQRFELLRAATIFERHELDQILDELAVREAMLRKQLADPGKVGDSFKTSPEYQQVRRLIARQLERIAASRTAWQRRFDLHTGDVSRDAAREWSARAAESVRLLEREQDAIRARLNESIGNVRLLQIDAASGPAVDRAQLITKALEDEFAALADLKRLQQRIIDESAAILNQVSLAERMQDFGAGALRVWRYELVSVEDRAITIGTAVSAALLLILGVIFSRFLSRLFGLRLLRRLGLEEGTATAYQMLLFYFLVALFLLFSLRTLNVPLTIFTVAGGALAIGVGFGSQNILNNFISGLILLAERPIRIGDMVDVDGTYGSVVHVGLRSTSVRSFNNVDIIVPNSTFLETNVINWTLSNDLIRIFVTVGVAYGSPVEKVRELVLQAVTDHPKVLKTPEPIVLFADFADNSLNFEAHFWIRMKKLMDRRIVESDIRYRMDALFREAGIVIAFPQRDVHLDTPEPLSIRLLRDGRPQPAT